MNMRWLSLLALLSLLPGGVAAQTPRGLGADAPPVAESRYQSGLRLYRAGQFAAAADEFRVALAMHRVPKLAYNLARSLERAGDLSGAIEHYRLYLKLAPGAADRDEIKRLIPILEDRLRAKYPEVALLSEPAGARVFADGGKTPIVEATPGTAKLPPGLHLLRFELEGRPPVERSVHLAEGADVPVEVKFAKPAVAAPAPPPAPAPAPERAAWRTPVAIGLMGAGAVGLGLGVISSMRMSDTIDEAGEPITAARYDELNSEFESQQTWAVVGFAAGGALVAGGVTLLLWPDDEAPAAAALAPTPGGVVLAGRF